MIEFQAQGEYEFRVHGGPRDGLLLNRSKNLITDYGLDWFVGLEPGYYMHQGPLYGCYVGTGTVAPEASDLSLGALAMSTTTIVSSIPASGDVTVTVGASDRYYELQRVFRFAAAASNVNLTEVAVGSTSTTVASRALIVDGGGNPTPVTLLTGEQLDVTYKLRVTAPTKDVAASTSNCGSGSVVIGATTYNYTAYLHSFGPWAGIQLNANWPGQLAAMGASDINVAANQLLTYPTGSWPSQIAVACTKAKQSAGKARLTFTIPLSHATAGVGRILLQPTSSYAAFAFVFDEVIPKDADSTLKLDVDYQMVRG